MRNFIHLHVHSHYSMLDGMGKIPDLVKRAKELKMPALALTDHGVMHGAIEFYEECVKEGIKPLVGCELYLAPRSMSDKVPKVDVHPYHLVLIAKNYQGYKNLIKLTTLAHLEGYYYKPRVDKKTLKKYAGDLIAMTACVQGEIPRLILSEPAKAETLAKEYEEVFGKGNFFLEIQHHNEVENQEEINKAVYALGQKLNIPVVATNDCHYIHSDDAEAQDVLVAVQTGKAVNIENRLSMRGDDYSMVDQKKMAEWFRNFPGVLENTLEVAEMCDLKIELGGMILPHFTVPKGYDETSYLEELCYLGLNWRYGDNRLKKTDLDSHRKIDASILKIPEEIWRRFEYELDIINKMGYQSYFLIVHDFINWAKKQGISVGPGRGSAAGSIISYVLNITNLNPLDYGLLFERFLNPDRISMPDIDMDFADSRRGEVIDYVVKKYGKDHVAQIITFGTMAARMAVRDVGRALGMTYSEVDLIAKMIPAGLELKKAAAEVPELHEVYESNAQIKKLIDIATRLEGVVRHASMHAAGVVITKDPLTEYVPLQAATKGDLSTVTQYSMNPLEHLGLLKMDFLGLANLTIIQNALRIIRKTREQEIDIDNLKLDDPEVYKLLSDADTLGVFQLESDGMRRYLKELKPNVFEDIIAMVALYRPGPMQWIGDFIERKHGRQQIKYAHPLAEGALKNTYGIIVYQEQLMQLSKDMAGFSGGQADTLRKAMGKKIAALMEKVGREFIEGSVKNGVEREIAEGLYKSMQDFAQYAFNKSHAACYALIAYQTAYLKTHYRPEFMAALMTSEQSDLDKLAQCIEECGKMEIEVLPPSINESFEEFGVVKETGNIRFGLAAIKNVGLGVAQEIVENRKTGGQFKDLEDFVSRLSGKVVNKKAMESLIMAGALDDVGERGQLLYNIESILSFASSLNRGKSSGLQSLFGEAQMSAAKIQLHEAPPATKKDRLSWERELIGICISENPLGDAIHLVRQHSQPIVEINESYEGAYRRVAGVITAAKQIMTRSNQPMLFVKLEDHSKNIEIVVFPRLLEANRDLFSVNKIVAVDGFINYKDGEPKMVAESAWELGEQTTLPQFTPRKRNQKSNIKNQKYGSHSERSEESQNSNQNKPVSDNNNYPLTSKPSRQPITDNRQLTLTVPKDADKHFLLEIREILEVFPGRSQVILKIPNNGDSREIKIKNKVEITTLLKTRLSKILGKENIKVD